MSNRLFQSVIHQMKDSLDNVIGVIDETGTIIACSELGRIGEVLDSSVGEQVFSGTETVSVNDMTFKSFGSPLRPEYAVFVDGSDDAAKKYVGVLNVAVSNIKQYYDEKYDRGNFIKNVMLDNILPGDISIKARELHFNNDTTRAVLLIRISEPGEISVFDIIQNLFPDKTKDFVVNINESDIALVKEVRQNIESLGIARLIYQLPTTLCDMFLKEVFKRGSIESLDHETLFTIQKFFENNLNVSETSRKLFVHRNTLVYRLEKIRKLTGLDLREFDDAIVFKVALMVKKYLDSNPVKY